MNLKLTVFMFIFASTFSNADTNDFVDSVTSVRQAKNNIATILSHRESCAFGSCASNADIQVCEYVGALDSKVGYRITGQMTGVEPDIKISLADLKLMKQIFSHCKPSNYQYWLHDSVFHVEFSPSNSERVRIRKVLID